MPHITLTPMTSHEALPERNDRETVKNVFATDSPAANSEVDFSSIAWPDHLGQILCLSIPTTNLSQIKDFYRHYDPLKNGIRGGDSTPPRTDEGILRLFHPLEPKKTIDVVLPCPTGFIYDPSDNRFLITSQSKNSILELSSCGIREILIHPLFNHLHSMDYYNGLLAVASAGTDTILVFDITAEKEVFRWLATENGYDLCPNGEARKIAPETDHRPHRYTTLQQTTHVNSVVISRTEPGVVYATLFHQGEIVRIDMRNSRTTRVLTGLSHPHGLKPDDNGGYVFTQASAGRVTIFNSEFRWIESYHDSEVEWLQDACALTRDEFAYTDAYNAKLKVFNLPRKSIEGGLHYEPEFKVYQVRSIKDKDIERFYWLRELNKD